MYLFYYVNRKKLCSDMRHEISIAVYRNLNIHFSGNYIEIYVPAECIDSIMTNQNKVFQRAM